MKRSSHTIAVKREVGLGVVTDTFAQAGYGVISYTTDRAACRYLLHVLCGECSRKTKLAVEWEFLEKHNPLNVLSDPERERLTLQVDLRTKHAPTCARKLEAAALRAAHPEWNV